MNLEKLVLVESKEEDETSMRPVTATIAFEFKGGVCADESLQPLYDFLAPKKEDPYVVDDSETNEDEVTPAKEAWEE